MSLTVFRVGPRVDKFSDCKRLTRYFGVSQRGCEKVANGLYQLLDPLSPEEYAALRADIEARGILIPVEKDEDGNTLDGHHREQIAGELGIGYPTVVRRFASEEEKADHVVKINLSRGNRREPLVWGRAFAKLLERRGVRTGQGARNDKATSDTVSEVATELGVHERTARRRLKMAETFEALPERYQRAVMPPDPGAGPPTSPMTLKEALRAYRKELASEERQKAADAAAEGETREGADGRAQAAEKAKDSSADNTQVATVATWNDEIPGQNANSPPETAPGAEPVAVPEPVPDAPSDHPFVAGINKLCAALDRDKAEVIRIAASSGGRYIHKESVVSAIEPVN